jgi:WD40 repeat protein
VDGHEKIILGSNNGKIKIWNLMTAECTKVLEGHTDAVYCVKMISNNRLASGSVDKTIKIWNLSDDSCVKTLIGHTKRIFSLCFIEDDNILLSGAGEGLIKVWDLEELTCTKTLHGHNGAITCLKISNEKKLFSGSWDNTIKIWDLDSFECENSLYFDGFYTDYLDFFSNNNLISFHQSRKNVFIKIWNIEEGSCLKTIKMPNAVKIKLLNDNLLFVVYEKNKNKSESESDNVYEYEIWNIEEQISIKSFTGYKYTGSFYGLELLPNGNLVFCTDQLITLINI